MTNTISIKQLFGEYTGLRHANVSEKSGEEFYNTILNERFKDAAQKKYVIIVDLDGIRGYSPSFIDEAFGNLVFDFGVNMVKRFLKIKSDDKPYWITAIEKETYKVWEERRMNGKKPVKTISHNEWWSWNNNQFVKIN